MSIFKQSLKDLNFAISFFYIGCLIKIKERRLYLCLPISKESIVGSILFLSVLAPWEMRTAKSRIWTWVTEFIYYDDNLHLTWFYCLMIIVS